VVGVEVVGSRVQAVPQVGRIRATIDKLTRV
jgi:hypothetical protein